MIDGTVLRNTVLACIELNNDAVTITRFRVWENINSAIVSLLRVVPLCEIDTVVKSRLCDLTIYKSQYQFPTDYARLGGLWVNFGADLSGWGTHAYECVEAKDRQFYGNSLHHCRFSKQQPHFMYVEGGFDLRPVPDANQTNGYRIKYIYIPPTVTAGQQCLLRADFTDAIVFKAVQLCCLIDGYNVELSKHYSELYDKELIKFGVENRRD